MTSIQTNMAGTFPRCTSCVLGMYCITGVKFVLEHCPTCGKNLRLISILSDESPQQVYEFERRMEDRTVDENTGAVLAGLLDSAGVLDKDGVARVGHPLFFVLSKKMQAAGLAKTRGK